MIKKWNFIRIGCQLIDEEREDIPFVEYLIFTEIDSKWIEICMVFRTTLDAVLVINLKYLFPPSRQIN